MLSDITLTFVIKQGYRAPTPPDRPRTFKRKKKKKSIQRKEINEDRKP
jgi:hypothetical protein